jgi:hypothetical protein
MLDYLITVAAHLRALHNYDGLMQVLSALHSAPIQKLKRAWAVRSLFLFEIMTLIPLQLVNRKSMEVLEKLTELMSNLSHYKTYYDAYYALDQNIPALPLSCMS